MDGGKGKQQKQQQQKRYFEAGAWEGQKTGIARMKRRSGRGNDGGGIEGKEGGGINTSNNDNKMEVPLRKRPQCNRAVFLFLLLWPPAVPTPQVPVTDTTYTSTVCVYVCVRVRSYVHVCVCV